MENVVILRKDDLRSVVKEAVAEAMNEKKATPQTLSVDEAVTYLNANGAKISKSTIYKLTSEGKIPFRRFGERKLIFDRNELEQWAQDRIR